MRTRAGLWAGLGAGEGREPGRRGRVGGVAVGGVGSGVQPGAGRRRAGQWRAGLGARRARCLSGPRRAGLCCLLGAGGKPGLPHLQRPRPRCLRCGHLWLRSLFPGARPWRTWKRWLRGLTRAACELGTEGGTRRGAAGAMPVLPEATAAGRAVALVLVLLLPAVPAGAGALLRLQPGM